MGLRKQAWNCGLQPHTGLSSEIVDSQRKPKGEDRQEWLHAVWGSDMVVFK